MPDSPRNDVDANTAVAATLASSLAQLGVSDVAISPGSRSTPLALAFHHHPSLRTWIHHDERSAAFFALGHARITGRPAVLICTSGTAGANYHPAVIEAHEARIPMIVLTSDRPSRMRDTGAPQTIDQVKLFGDTVRWFHQGELPSAAVLATTPSLAAHVMAAATGLVPGPVHVNLPFDEPLSPDAPHREGHVVTDVTVPALTQPVAGLTDEDAAALLQRIDGQRVVVVVGAVTPAEAGNIKRIAAHLGAPVLADPQSHLRGAGCVTTADLLTAAGALDRRRPDVVLRFGGLPTSKPLWTWLADHPEVEQIVVDPAGWRDATNSATVVVRSGASAVAAAVCAQRSATVPWSAEWDRLDAVVTAAVATATEAGERLDEPSVARTVVASLKDEDVLYVGSSMPIRDVDTFGGPTGPDVTIVANRGANGIDGLVSSALGAAATGRRTVALCGDVTALHDIGALAGMARHDVPLTLVIVDNDGGGIFSFLPQADPTRVPTGVFEELFGTPHGVDFVDVARSFGLVAEEVRDPGSLAMALDPAGGPDVIVVPTERAANVARHRQLRALVADVLSGA